jgi:hypothetical protein
MGYLLAASLDASWSATLPLDRLGPVVGDIVSMVVHAAANPEIDHTDEPLWINVAPSADPL